MSEKFQPKRNRFPIHFWMRSISSIYRNSFLIQTDRNFYFGKYNGCIVEKKLKISFLYKNILIFPLFTANSKQYKINIKLWITVIYYILRRIHYWMKKSQIKFIIRNADGGKPLDGKSLQNNVLIKTNFYYITGYLFRANNTKPWVQKSIATLKGKLFSTYKDRLVVRNIHKVLV